MFHNIPLKLLVGMAVFLLAVLLGIGLGTDFGRKGKPQVQALETSISDALLLNKNLKKVLNVHKEITPRHSKTDTNAVGEIWFVPNGMSIPNYMLRAAREIERCKGTIHLMKEIRNGRAALLKYEGEQGIYPLTEIRIMDSLWQPNSSKLAVVLAVRERNKLLNNKPEILDKLNFTYNLLIPSSRPELLEIGKKLNVNIIPWVPMESRENIYNAEKKFQIPLGLANEKELAKRLERILKQYDKPSGFAAFNGEDFLVHPASMEMLGNMLLSKGLWFWDLSKRGIASLSPMECLKKELRCRKDYLETESEEQIKKTLRTARTYGSAILLFELTEKSITLLEKLPTMAEKQGTRLTIAEEVF
ncbi:MAG: divergent polysaccharide deacetylase family protein [Fibromonadales bacterium]|nr:divergent polysaccharide deacetylase family protein [Fibromonadales bacterium]